MWSPLEDHGGGVACLNEPRTLSVHPSQNYTLPSLGVDGRFEVYGGIDDNMLRVQWRRPDPSGKRQLHVGLGKTTRQSRMLLHINSSAE